MKKVFYFICLIFSLLLTSCELIPYTSRKSYSINGVHITETYSFQFVRTKYNSQLTVEVSAYIDHFQAVNKYGLKGGFNLKTKDVMYGKRTPYDLEYGEGKVTFEVYKLVSSLSFTGPGAEEYKPILKQELLKKYNESMVERLLQGKTITYGLGESTVVNGQYISSRIGVVQLYLHANKTLTIL